MHTARLTTPALIAGTLALAPLAGHADDITLHALMEDVPETQIIEKMLPEFEKQTGIKVEFEKVGYGDMHDKLVAQLVGGQSYYNLLEVDFLWAGEFPRAGWLTDLKPYVEKSGFDMKPFIPSTLELLGDTAQSTPLIPMYNYSMGLIYRDDLLNDPKLQAAWKDKTGQELALPSTVAGYVELAKFMKANAGLDGAAMQGQKGDPNAMEFSNYLFGNGGSYVGADGKVTLDSPAAVDALKLYADAIGNAAQTGALSATLDDTMRLMCSGKAFSMITYWWMLPQLDDAAACPAVAGKLKLAVMPGGAGESGGWGWGIPANVSPAEKDAAWKFITWVQDRKTAVARAMQGHAPVRSDVFEDADVLKAHPYYADAMKIVEAGKSFPIFTYSAQYEDTLGTQISMAASGDATPDAAIKAAAKGLSDLMKK